MSLMTSGRFINAMRKSRAVLERNLATVTQEQATTARDGADGWTVLEVMCHVRDFDDIFFNRALLAANQDHPTLPRYDHLGLVIERGYAQQDFHQVIKTYHDNREKFLNWLAELPEEQWTRTAEHPESGSITIYEIAMQTALHDLDHLEQMLRSLASAS